MFYVYVITNPLGKIYIGQTENPATRLARHNGKLSSKTRSYTKLQKGPWKLVYQEEYLTRIEAIKKEKYLKSHHGRDWLRDNVMSP